MPLHLDEIESIKLRGVAIESSADVNALAVNDTLTIALKEKQKKKRGRTDKDDSG